MLKGRIPNFLYAKMPLALTSYVHESWWLNLMGIVASGENYVRIVNKPLSKPGPRSCSLRNWQVLSYPPFPGHTSLYSAAPNVSFLNQKGLLTYALSMAYNFTVESSVFSPTEQINVCRFLRLLLPPDQEGFRQ